MTRLTSLSPTAGDRAAARPVRGFLLALGVVLASGVALAAWSATEEVQAPRAGLMLPRGLIHAGLVPNARQRQAIAGELAGAPRAFAGFHRPLAAEAARND